MENKLLANEIRDALKTYLNRPSYLEEFTFYDNGTIADLLDTSDKLIGYEIKSNSDTYTRLPKQILGYNSTCEKVYMVVGDKKSKSVFNHIPDFYGVMVASRDEIGGTINFELLREAQQNPHRSIQSLLMWLPSVELKRFAKSIPNLLAAFDNKKTLIQKRTKDLLLSDIYTFSTESEIEARVMAYLQSDELRNKRQELADFNNQLKAQAESKRELELNQRISNFEYAREDALYIESQIRIGRFGRLSGLNSNYLPLSIEYSPEYIHKGGFIFDEESKMISFKLDIGKDSITIPKVTSDLQFWDSIRLGLQNQLSCLELFNLLKK